MTGTNTYTNRRWLAVAGIERKGDDNKPWYEAKLDNGLSCGAPQVAYDAFRTGALIQVEEKGGPFGRIVGWVADGVYLERLSDEELAEEHRQWVAQRDAENEKYWQDNKRELIGRAENLPDWLKDRFQVFRERGGHNFEVNGFGYELVICELAALYDQDPNFGPRDQYPYDMESAEVKAYHEEHGTSGNQADCARALVLHHRAGKTLAGTVSGLSPLTGDPFYEGRDKDPTN